LVKSFSSAAIIKRLRKAGWKPRRLGRSVKGGSHRQFTHPGKPGLRVTITHPVKDIPIGTLRSIFRQAGWDWPP
jgi:predicted RNA binding protein YcfA (HicA-like mRNA interferase family)